MIKNVPIKFVKIAKERLYEETRFIRCFIIFNSLRTNEEMVKLVEDEYSALDCDILKVEQDLLTQMIEEEERSLAKANTVNLAIGLISIAATG